MSFLLVTNVPVSLKGQLEFIILRVVTLRALPLAQSFDDQIFNRGL